MSSQRRLAIVTGAARGIGAATALRLADEGFTLALLDIDEAALEQRTTQLATTGASVWGFACDVGNPAAVAAALDEVTTQLGPVDTLINNAGIGGPFHRVDEVSDAEWTSLFDTNVRSVFLLSKAVLPRLREAGFGRIVNVASIQGFLGAARSSTYVACKHAVIGYTRALAVEWGGHGITINAVCPGYVDTAMGAQDAAGDDHRGRIVAKTPAGRLAIPSEVAHLITFLVAAESGFINGSTFVIDGGLSCHVGL